MFNWTKAFMLVTAITTLFIVIGGIIGRRSGMMLALLLTLGMNFFSYQFSDKMILHMYNTQEVNETSALQFYRMVQELAGRAGLPMPRVYLIDGVQPNAFATGRNPGHATVATATDILNILSECELRGMMTHGLAHVQHRDILISTISAAMVGAISALANFAVFFGGRGNGGRPTNPIAGIAVTILTPLAASLIQMAISRARESGADHGGAAISGGSQALTSALGKIHHCTTGIPFAAAEAHPATAQMMVMNPLHSGDLANLFNAHPTTEKCIARLIRMAQTGQYPA